MLLSRWFVALLAVTALCADRPLEIESPCVPGQPFTVAGDRGAIFGRQNGVFEAWQWPVKILSHFHINAEMADYPVPIDVNALAADIRVTPAETVITYSHAAFTIRQRMRAQREGGGAGGPAVSVRFEIESVRPLEVTFSFTPEMLRMWPAPNFGRPNAEWVEKGGFYILHTDNPQFSGTVFMPGTRPGVMVPYQEHPQTYPVELKLSFDPKRNHGKSFPLITTLGAGKGFDDIGEASDSYDHFFKRRLTIETPDPKLDEAFRWAEVSIDQAQVKLGAETGLVAGYYESADSARPGYAWFFGRDTEFTTYAINSYGDFALTRHALDFLIHRQRDDGKIMHEFSQAADAIDWKATPYFYAAADSTPLFVMAMRDYVRTSGDVAYLKAHWGNVKKAYVFTRAHDSDHDGIYENTEGTGWVESWPPGMPHQEIYLAALDQQSSHAIAELAALVGDQELAAQAQKTADRIRLKIESEYYEPASRFYAFSRNANGGVDRTASIYPAIAWWDGTLALQQPDAMMNRWASAEFSADWGLRDISDKTKFYDPISYHQGTVWPLFTGWVSLAEYRAGRTLAGYQHLMQNANLTWAQDLGSVTELLSGEFFQPLGRSSSHQTWSSAMVITPIVRGMFGLDWDVPRRVLRVSPNLPANWEHARLRHVPFGNAQVDLDFTRSAQGWVVQASTDDPQVICLVAEETAADCATRAAKVHSVTIPARAVELAIPAELPSAGSKTAQLKVLDERYERHKATFTFAAQGGASYDLPARTRGGDLHVQGGEFDGRALHLKFPSGEGYTSVTTTFAW